MEKAKDIEVEVLTERFRGKVVVSVDKETWIAAEKDMEWAVVMKLSSQKFYKYQDFIFLMKKAWGVDSLTVVELGNNILVTKFESEADMTKALEEGPWSFRGATVLMEQWKRGCNPEDIQINHLHIWVQIHNLPFTLRKQKTAAGFAALAGEIIKGGYKVDHPQNTETITQTYKAKFLRFKIRLDLSKPPCCGCYLKMEEGGYIWVDFRYERMPNFCDLCGRIDHDMQSCITDLRRTNEGKWIRGLDKTVRFEQNEVSEQIELIQEPLLEEQGAEFLKEQSIEMAHAGKNGHPREVPAIGIHSKSPEKIKTVEADHRKAVGKGKEVARQNFSDKMDTSSSTAERYLESVGVYINKGLSKGAGTEEDLVGSTKPTSLTNFNGSNMAEKSTKSVENSLVIISRNKSNSKSGKSRSGKESRFHPYKDAFPSQATTDDNSNAGDDSKIGDFLSAEIARRSRRGL